MKNENEVKLEKIILNFKCIMSIIDRKFLFT